MQNGRRRKLEVGLRCLLDAHEYVRDAGLDDWQFAVEVQQLKTLGLDANEFRWLISKGYVDHALEITAPGDAQRTFRRVSTFRPGRWSCFVLSNRGLSAAKSLDGQGEPNGRPPEDSGDRQERLPAKAPNDPVNGLVPTWDGERHELRLGGRVVKRFRRPSLNQEAILATFQEENWPACIADPLSPSPEIDPKRRLNDTLKALNRNQKQPLLRFLGDGTGEGVIWETVGGSQPTSAPYPVGVGDWRLERLSRL